MEPVIWACAAIGHPYSYVVETLDRAGSQFELKIYDAPQFSRHRETVVMQIQPAQLSQPLIGNGKLKSGAPIQVIAFPNGGVGFRVIGAQSTASGHCVRNVSDQ
jgi:hypothetical protein